MEDRFKLRRGDSPDTSPITNDVLRSYGSREFCRPANTPSLRFTFETDSPRISGADRTRTFGGSSGRGAAPVRGRVDDAHSKLYFNGIYYAFAMYDTGIWELRPVS